MEFTPVWNGIIAWYLFLAGLGAGAFASAFFLGRFCSGTQAMVRIGRLIAPVVVAIGLVLLMFDARGGLYHPLRFAFLLTNFQSVMTWGVVFLGAFEVVALVVAVMDLARKNPPRWLEVVGVVLSVCVAVYTGALLGACAPYPLWNLAILPILFLASAASAGAAAVLGIGAVAFPAQYARTGKLQHIHLAFMVAEVVVLVVLLAVTAGISPEGALSVQRLTSGDYAGLFWGVLVIVGLAAPIIIDLVMTFVARKAPGAKASGAVKGGSAEEMDPQIAAAGSAVSAQGEAPYGAEVASPSATIADETADGASRASAVSAPASAPVPSAAVRALSALACAGGLAGGYTLRYLVIMAALPAGIAFPWL